MGDLRKSVTTSSKKHKSKEQKCRDPDLPPKQTEMPESWFTNKDRKQVRQVSSWSLNAVIPARIPLNTFSSIWTNFRVIPDIAWTPFSWLNNKHKKH